MWGDTKIVTPSPTPSERGVPMRSNTRCPYQSGTAKGMPTHTRSSSSEIPTGPMTDHMTGSMRSFQSGMEGSIPSVPLSIRSPVGSGTMPGPQRRVGDHKDRVCKADRCCWLDCFPGSVTLSVSRSLSLGIHQTEIELTEAFCAMFLGIGPLPLHGRCCQGLSIELPFYRPAKLATRDATSAAADSCRLAIRDKAFHQNPQPWRNSSQP